MGSSEICSLGLVGSFMSINFGHWGWCCACQCMLLSQHEQLQVVLAGNLPPTTLTSGESLAQQNISYSMDNRITSE